MSIQKVKCPNCGTTYTAYIDAKTVINCTVCKGTFNPFDNESSTPSPQATERKPESTKYQSQADKIIASVQSISKLLADCLKEKWLSAGEERLLTQIKAELKKLFNIICQTMDSPQGLKPALATVFTFPDLSSRPQTLELILTYFYGGMFQLQDKSVRMLFEDYGHQMIANELVEKNKAKVAQLISQ